MSRRNQGPRLRWLDKRECYYVVWTEHGRSRECSTGTRDSQAAEDFFAKWMQRRGQRNGPRDPSSVLITEILDQYLAQRAPKVAAPARLMCAAIELTEFFEGNCVSDISPQVCARYADRRQRRPTSKAKAKRTEKASAPISAGTIRRELGVLRAAINLAHKNGLITRPVSVELPPRPDARDRWLTRKEAAALIRATRTPQARLYMPLFVLLGLYTGRRKEAILSLRWPQVDLQARTINFDIAGRRRTNKKRGIIPVPPRLLPHLRRARKRGADLGFVLHIDGERIKDIKKGFKGACDRAGIERASPHTLRHTAATWLMQAGVDPWQAAGYLAMSVETLLRTYGHHHPDYQRNAAEAIGRRPQIVRVTG